MNAPLRKRRRLPVIPMPATRAACEGEGLCLKFSCRFNVTLHVKSGGGITLNTPREGYGERPVWPPIPDGTTDARYPHWNPSREEQFLEELVEHLDGLDMNCALDIADATGGETQDEVAARLGVSYEIVSKVERAALFKLAQSGAADVLRRLLRARLDAADDRTTTDYGE